VPRREIARIVFVPALVCSRRKRVLLDTVPCGRFGHAGDERGTAPCPVSFAPGRHVRDADRPSCRTRLPPWPNQPEGGVRCQL